MSETDNVIASLTYMLPSSLPLVLVASSESTYYFLEWLNHSAHTSIPHSSSRRRPATGACHTRLDKHVRFPLALRSGRRRLSLLRCIHSILGANGRGASQNGSARYLASPIPMVHPLIITISSILSLEAFCVISENLSSSPNP